MAIKFTPWFSIDKDGHPIRPGWYEVLYAHEEEEEADGTTRYWDGKIWCGGKGGMCVLYGSGNTRHERWRGLTAEAK